MKRAALIAAVLLLALTPGDRFLGIFETDRLHNMVYIGVGLLGLAMSVSRPTARLYFRAIGFVFGLFTVMGFLAGREGHVFGMLMNRADDVLDLFIAASSLWLGFAWDRTQSPRVIPA